MKAQRKEGELTAEIFFWLSFYRSVIVSSFKSVFCSGFGHKVHLRIEGELIFKVVELKLKLNKTRFPTTSAIDVLHVNQTIYS